MLESDVVGLHGLFAAGGLVEQGRHPKGFRLMREKLFLQECQGKAGVENVFHEDDILFLHGLIHIFAQAYFAGRIPSALEFLRRAGPVTVA